MKKSPLQTAKEQFKVKGAGKDARKDAKTQLVDAVRKLATDDLWLDRVNEDKGLEHVSTAKLLRLQQVLGAVKKEFGSRAQLIDAILTAEKRSGDEGYKARLERFPTPRLWDQYQAAKGRPN